VEGLQHILQAADSRHNEATYIFGILTIEYNNSPVEVNEALLHIDKFSTPPLSDWTIQEWNRSVCWKTIIMLKKYEEFGWGVGSLLCRTSHNAILRGAKR
jgi:hypothetical protein